MATVTYDEPYHANGEEITSDVIFNSNLSGSLTINGSVTVVGDIEPGTVIRGKGVLRVLGNIGAGVSIQRQGAILLEGHVGDRSHIESLGNDAIQVKSIGRGVELKTNSGGIYIDDENGIDESSIITSKTGELHVKQIKGNPELNVSIIHATNFDSNAPYANKISRYSLLPNFAGSKPQIRPDTAPAALVGTGQTLFGDQVFKGDLSGELTVVGSLTVEGNILPDSRITLVSPPSATNTISSGGGISASSNARITITGGGSSTLNITGNQKPNRLTVTGAIGQSAQVRADEVRANKVDGAIIHSSGAVTVNEVLTQAKISSVNGTIKVNSTVGEGSQLSTSNGRIETKSIGSGVELQTVNGSIKVDGNIGARARVSSVNGSISASTAHSSATIKTINGRVSMAGTVSPKASSSVHPIENKTKNFRNNMNQMRSAPKVSPAVVDSQINLDQLVERAVNNYTGFSESIRNGRIYTPENSRGFPPGNLTRFRHTAKEAEKQGVFLNTFKQIPDQQGKYEAIKRILLDDPNKTPAKSNTHSFVNYLMDELRKQTHPQENVDLKPVNYSQSERSQTLSVLEDSLGLKNDSNDTPEPKFGR